eukprot:CAMPEP_0185168094 /NCGR_PEP_ID=MMETSP1139-20130426/15335_1 /TAXON_ID=298111 /ORGANISM="Pavlova sp., Strain CCMP459" /LENGTH=176 /DNA_ID=CAMNT_0027733595 /DNA_START=209 /DNA_END=741 /DNA_ORIENTATION=-
MFVDDPAGARVDAVLLLAQAEAPNVAEGGPISKVESLQLEVLATALLPSQLLDEAPHLCDRVVRVDWPPLELAHEDVVAALHEDDANQILYRHLLPELHGGESQATSTISQRSPRALFLKPSTSPMVMGLLPAGWATEVPAPPVVAFRAYLRRAGGTTRARAPPPSMMAIIASSDR